MYTSSTLAVGRPARQPPSGRPLMASPERKGPNAVLKPSVLRRLVRPIRSSLAAIGRASSLGVTGIIPHTPEQQNGPGLSALIRGTAQNTTRNFPSAAQRLGLHTAGLVCTMHAANGLPHGEAATPEQPKHTSYLAAITPPRQRENAATRSRAIPVAAAPPRCCRGGRSDGRHPPCATWSTCTRSFASTHREVA